MKRIGLTVVLLAFAQALWAESSPDSLVTIMVKHWQVSKELTLAVANAMPEADYIFRATPAEMTFGEQMNHIALGNTSYCARAMNTKSPLTKGEDNTKATAIKNLDTAYDFCIGGLEKMTDAELLKPMTASGHTVTAFEMFWGGFTHAAHHRGQTEVYLRLKGITPPPYEF